MCPRIFAPGGRLVTAGDGNMVSVGHKGPPRQAPGGAGGPTTQDRSTGPRRGGRTYVRTQARGRAVAYAGRGGDHVPGGSQDRHTLGKSRQADVDPYSRWPPPVPGDRGPCPARGDPAATFGLRNAHTR